MPQFVAGYSSKIYTAQYDLSPYFNAADTTRSWAELKSTAFGNTAEMRQPGLQDGTAKLSGFYAGDAFGIQAALDNALGSAAGEPTTLGMIGDALIGNPCYLWLNRTANATVKSTPGSLVAVDANFQAAKGGLAPGLWVHPQGVENVGANTATGLDNLVLTTAGWRAILHLFSVAGTVTPTLNVKFQDSADNTTFADLSGGAFAAMTAVGAQYLVGAAGATVRRYLRILWTITGTTPAFGFAVSFARQV